MLFSRIFKELGKAKVQYVVVGGIAVNLHGFARATGDLDIMLSFDAANVKKFVEAVKRMKLRSRIPVKIEEIADRDKRLKWVKEKNMKVFSLYNPENAMEQLDVMIENQMSFEDVYKKREIISIGSVKIPLVSIDDLIKLKKKAGRDRDRIDIDALKRIKELKK